jgi:hypothetical protein
MTPEEQDARVAVLEAKQKARETLTIEGKATASGSDQ